MVRGYHFLVAGLPDLLMEESKSAPPLKTFIAEAKEQMTPRDFDLVSAMARCVDNRNLVNALEPKDGAEFDESGNFSQEELEEGIKEPEQLPAYMRAFLEAYKEGSLANDGYTMIDRLSRMFYSEMAASKNRFQRDWFAFDLGLRNVVTGINIRKGLGHIEALSTSRDRPGAFTVIGEDDIAEAVLKSSAPDFGLSAEYPWVEKVIALNKNSLTEMEKGLDDLRWDMLNELTVFTYYRPETVAAYVQKLMIVNRWMKLNPVVGKEKLDKLIAELMSSFEMPEGF